MLINSLELMEKVVSSNSSLRWNGWDVVHFYKNAKGQTSNQGVLINGEWHIQKIFSPNRDGWNIPDRLINNHA